MARFDRRDDAGYGWSAWVGILVFLFIIVGIFMLAGGDGDDTQVSMRDNAPTSQAPAPSPGNAPTTPAPSPATPPAQNQ